MAIDIREILALNLRKFRPPKVLSQEVHRAEIDRAYIRALERGVYAASIDVVDRLARVLGAETSDLHTWPSPTTVKKEAEGNLVDSRRVDVRSRPVLLGAGHRPRRATDAETRPCFRGIADMIRLVAGSTGSRMTIADLLSDAKFNQDCG
jgi:hypothetical protein